MKDIWEIQKDPPLNGKQNSLTDEERVYFNTVIQEKKRNLAIALLKKRVKPS